MLRLPSFCSGDFKIFKNALGQFIPNRPPKHVITSTNCTAQIMKRVKINLLCFFVLAAVVEVVSSNAGVDVCQGEKKARTSPHKVNTVKCTRLFGLRY